MDERLTMITIGGKEFPMMLSVYATKQIIKRFGGLENVGEHIQKADYAEQIETTMWLLTTLINGGIMFLNYKNNTKDPLIEQEHIEAVISPSDFIEYRDAIFTTMNKGAARHVKSEETLDSKNVERE